MRKVPPWFYPKYLEYGWRFYYLDLPNQLKINLGSVKMQANILVASISGRFIPGAEGATQEKIKQTILMSLIMVNQILPLSEHLRGVDQDKFVASLGFDDRAYIEFCDLLVTIVEKRCKLGDFDLPVQIKETNEVRQWIQEAGFTVAAINLIDRWKHPLAQINSPSPQTDNLATCNTWMFASMGLSINKMSNRRLSLRG